MFCHHVIKTLSGMALIITLCAMVISCNVVNSDKLVLSHAAISKADGRIIVCHVYYRSSYKQGEKQQQWQKQISLSKNSPLEIEQGQFKLKAIYSDDGHDSPSVAIIVEQKDKQTTLSRSLYQFASLSDISNYFLSHGFTGLNYVYIADSPAELQYWCSIESQTQNH